LSGGRAESTLEDYFDTRGKNWLRHPYTELGEMNDAYAVQRCHALAAETTELANTRLHTGPARLRSRLLPDTLDVFPIVAATGVQDGRWSALVNWVVATLITAERPERKWFAGGARAMPIDAGAFGLAAGWQDRLVKTVGDYGTLYERNLGMNSPYGMQRGLSASPAQGGLLLSPFVE
jgi:general L-amino acid transport system substrate-binding protein